MTVPDGWEQYYGVLWADVDGRRDFETLGGVGEIAFGWWQPANVFTDPCHWADTLSDPPVGPTTEDLANAFAGQIGREGSEPTDVVFGGLPAKRVELSVPADLDVATCDQGVYRDFLDLGDSALNVPEPLVAPRKVSGQLSVLYILDIDGTRFMMNTWHRPETSGQDLAAMEAMLASIRIDLPAPSQSPASGPSGAGTP